MAALSGSQVLAAYKAAGADDQTALDLTRIAWRESRWDPTKHRTTVDRSLLRGDLGLTQINWSNDTPQARSAVGYTDRSAWLDPAVNARMAMWLVNDNRSRGGNGYDSWRAAPGGFSAGGVWTYGLPSEQTVKDAITNGTTPDGTDTGSDGGPGIVDSAIAAALGPLGSRFIGSTDDLKNLYKRITTLLNTILSPDWWRRILIGVAGLTIIGLGVAAVLA